MQEERNFTPLYRPHFTATGDVFKRPVILSPSSGVIGSQILNLTGSTGDSAAFCPYEDEAKCKN
jgi:hypothetical protein